MSDLRTAAQQALEALEAMQSYAAAERKGLRICDEAIPALRAALAQQAEPLNLRDPAVQKRLATQWGYVPAAQAEPVEPVAWECKAGGLKPLTQRQYDAQTAATKRHYTRIAPPQRQPLTDATLWGMWVDSPSDVLRFARAIERAHGIKE